MFESDDTHLYNMAVKELILAPIQGQYGTYHVKNGQVYFGYELVPVFGFSHSSHAWEILH
jgi:hypothetical protein